MIVAVTGAGGLVGKRLCAELESKGHEVRRLTRTPAGPDDRRFVLGAEVAPEVLAGCGALIHGAHDFTVRGWDAQMRVNVEGAFKVFAAAAAAKVGRLVFVSSVAAFKGCASEYGRGKLLVEDLVLRAGGVVVRPAVIYGGAGGFYGALSKLTASPVLPVFDGGRQNLYMVHNDEVARDLVGALTWDPAVAGGPVTLANPEPVTFIRLLRSMSRARGRDLRTFDVPSGLALAGLKTAEALRLPLRFTSDSLNSLLNPNPSLDWEPAKRLGLSYRPYPG